MMIKTSRIFDTPILIAALLALFVSPVSGPAQAEARWDGLYTDGPDVNWFDLKATTQPDNSLEARGIETDFSEDERFEPEFEIESFSDRIRRPFSGGDRDR